MLQYRTAQDDRVRASHQPLHNVTLPKEDPFWSSYYPPNGWRCRCVAVEVRKGKYEESDSEAAIAAGDKATTEIGKDGKNRLAIFRFNPGKEKVLFPPKHPYYPQHCKGDKLNVSGLIGLSRQTLNAENDKCRAKKVVEGMQRSAIAKRREDYVEVMKPLMKKNVSRYVGSDKRITIKFTKKGINHIADDVLGGINVISKKDLRALDKALKEAEYVRSAKLHKPRKDDIVHFYYFKDKEKELYYHVAESAEKTAQGRINLKRFLYSISQEIPVK